jgi:hypothetical protein
MKNNYKVWFSNGNYDDECVEVLAINQNNAYFIAKAQRIEDGLDSTLDHIEDISKVDEELTNTAMVQYCLKIITDQRIEELEKAVMLLTGSFTNWYRFLTAENVELIDRLVKEIEDNSCQKT